MKRIALLICSLTLSVGLFAQKELTISGGNCVSAMVCQNSVVYTWGKNSTEKGGTGLLGTGSTKDYESTPQEVTFFTKQDIYIRQVNCGSGSHFIALDCNGNVWCWGNNSLGQCGTGGTVVQTEGKIQATPIQVSTAGGDLSGSSYSVNNHLSNVDVVYAGNNNSFAILGDGEYKGCLVAWGGNSKGFDGQGYDDAYGQLGCGNTTNQAYPVFVLDGTTKKPLQGVVQVYAGDNTAYALVDPDGDGLGTVYSWGYQKTNGTLGRSATGGVGSEGSITDAYARPVYGLSDNIKMLGCGDGVGYALDEDGYIWAWGNGAWNNAAGVLDANYSWYSGTDTYATPLRVRAGLTDEESNDGEYLLAKWVAGGQGFGMAVTIDNKPVAWGGGGCSDGGGGATGTKIGQSADKAGAEYIVATGGTIFDDVVLINRADTWGFFGRSNGDLYAWGCNSNGELGIGSVVDQKTATKINPPSNCNPRHPDPTVDLTPGSMTVCASAFNGQLLDAGFVIDISLADYYTISWYKDGTLITSASGSVKEKGVTYKATEPGTYKVVITHNENGSGNGCVTYEPAEAEMTIATYEQNYTIPTIEYCGDTATVYVNTTNKTAIYSWYASKGANAKAIASTVGSEKLKLYVGDDVIAPNAGKKTIYVEETSAGTGKFIPSSFASFTSTQSISQQNNISNPGFTVNSAVTLRSFKLTATGAMTSYYVNGTATLSGALEFTVNLCKSKTDNGHVVADKTSIIKSFTGTMEMEKEITATGTYKITDEVVFDCGDYELEPGTYYLVFASGKATGSADANNSVVNYASKGLVGVKDTYTGEYIVGIGAAQDNNFKTDATGPFYDIEFATPQGFCDRIAIEMTENCPCNKPLDVEITGKSFLCEDGTTTLTPTEQEYSTKFYYEWYKGSIAASNLVAGPTKTAQLTYDVAYDDLASAGTTYIVKVYDVENPTTTSCQRTAEFTVTPAETPVYTITGGDEYCEGAKNISPVTITISKGTAPFNFTYKIGTKKKIIEDYEKTTLQPDVPTATTVYTMTKLEDAKGCEATDYTSSSTITIKPLPTANVAAVDPVCAGTTVNLSADDVESATYSWSGPNSYKSISQNPVLTSTTEKMTGTYTVTVTLNECTSTASTDVTVYAIPDAPTLTNNSPICAGEELKITAKAPTNVTSPTYEWTGPNSYAGTDQNVSIASATVDATGTYSVTATANGCTSDAATTTVTVNAIPDAPTVKDQAYCVNDTPKALEATATTGATLNWYGKNATGGTASSTAPTPTTTKADVGKTLYYVSQTLNGCESETRAVATVSVDDTLAPVITADPGFEVCENVEIGLNVDGTFSTTTWSGSGATSLDATTIQAPTFVNATSGSYIVNVSVVDSKGCKGSATKTITVNPIPSVTLSTLTDECVSNTTAQTLTATVSPTGTTGTGTWTGDVTKATETTAKYTPSVAGVGSHTIQYDFVSDKNCAAKQVSTTVSVNDLPTPTITVSNASVCVSGNNSDEVTVKTSGTTNTGSETFAYSINKGTVNASTGAFDPTANVAGDYTITLNYTDANGCKGTASADLTVHALPTVTLTNPSEICYNGAAIEIQATVNPDGGTGTWTGTASSSNATFDPSTVNVGTSEFTYAYTDIYKCQNSASSSIDVVSVEKPTVSADYQPKVVIINSGSLSDNTDLAANATTTGDKLQWKAYSPTAGTWADGSSTYATGKTATSDDGSYVYLIREYKMVDSKACYSDSVSATLVLSNCEALPPAASDIYICVGSTASTELSATRTPATSVTNYKISWLDIDPAGKLGTTADANILVDDKTTYTPTINVSAVGEYSYYVAEYDKDKTCWSAGKQVTIHVVDTPSVSITSPADICAIGSEAVPVTVTPQTGTLTTSEGTMSGFNWLPGNYSGAELKTTFTYVVTSNAYADGTTCSSTVKSTSTAHFMEAPTGSDNIWLIGDISGIPTGFLKGTNTSTGTSMKWYDTKTKTIELGTGTSYTPDKTELQTEVGSAKTYDKSYWITQTDAQGCESEPAEVTLSLVDCPWEAPTVSAIEECLGETLGDLVATEGASVATMAKGGSVSSWVWYDANGSEISGKTAASLAHGVSNTVAKTTNFSVAYKAIEKSSGQECQSPSTNVTVTVLPLPSITFDKTSEIVCYTTEETKVGVKAVSENGTGSGVWTITGDASAISSNGIFYAQKNGKISGQSQYTITYTYTDAKGCVNDADRTIDVIYLPAPETEGFMAMTTQTNPVTVKVISSLETGASAQWFETALSTEAKGNGVTWATGLATNKVDNKDYYARQYKDGCYSEPTIANVTIVDCPIPNVIINDEKACNYDDIPTLAAETGSWAERTAANSTFKFYKADATVAESTSADGTYQPNLTKEGEYVYYVSEYNTVPLTGLTNVEGCEGPKTKATITIIGTGQPKVSATINPAEVCEGEENPSFVASDIIGTIGWYEEDPGELGVPQSTQKSTSKSYLPSGRTTGSHNVWAVMYSNGCYGPKVVATYTIKEIPEPPTTTTASVCNGDANATITATGVTGATINWYADALKTTSLVKGSQGYQSKETVPATYTYYATQTYKGCESNTASVKYTIIALPAVPIISSQSNICEYDAAPVLRASGENITWYATADKTTTLGSGEEYQVTDNTTGTKKFYATQTKDGCEGLPSSVVYVVNAKPSNPDVKGASVCEGDTVIPSLTTNMITDKWYADESAVTYLAQGYSYSPTASMVGSSSKTYYVQRDMNGCVSDIMPVVLKVISHPQLTIGDDITTCIYDDVQTITASGFDPTMNDASSVHWQVKDGKVIKYFDSEENYTLTPTSTITEATDYEISAVYRYVADGIYCLSDTASITYSVKARARKPIVFTSIICQGEEIKDLQALGSKNIVWGSLDGTLPVVAYGKKYQFQAGQVLEPSTYRFVIYDQNIYDEENNLGCKSEIDTVTMTVAPAAETKLFGADSVCVGTIAEQYYTQYTKESTYFWNVTGNNLNYAKTDATSVRYVDWMEPGIDTLTVYEQTWAGCEGFDTLVVKIAPVPEPLFTWTMPGSTNIIELTDSTQQDSLWYTNAEGELVAEPVTYTLYWNYGHIGENEEDVDIEVPYEQRNYPITEGNYVYGYNCPILTVKNSFGCTEKYKECIFVNLTSSLYVPNAFSPTNPAHSVRNFQPKGYNLKTCEISVYDKWGNLLWYSDEVEDGMFVGKWDGRYDGKMMKSDVYIWKMEATFLDGQVWEGFDNGNGKKTKFGSVTLIR